MRPLFHILILILSIFMLLLIINILAEIKLLYILFQ